MENKMISKIIPLKLGYFHEEGKDNFLSGILHLPAHFGKDPIFYCLFV
ncbi:MAG: hypothetical protein ACJA0S_000502 [Rickettsiales bacterium]|jgi:hypothetical protein